jgi:hypothetical protein
VGRPPIRKSGAFTPAERQRRHRRKLKREKTAATEAARIAEAEKIRQRAFAEQKAAVAYYRELEAKRKGRDFLILKPLPENVQMLAEELARQFVRALRDFPGVTLDDVQAVLERWRAAR